MAPIGRSSAARAPRDGPLGRRQVVLTAGKWASPAPATGDWQDGRHERSGTSDGAHRRPGGGPCAPLGALVQPPALVDPRRRAVLGRPHAAPGPLPAARLRHDGQHVRPPVLLRHPPPLPGQRRRHGRRALLRGRPHPSATGRRPRRGLPLAHRAVRRRRRRLGHRPGAARRLLPVLRPHRRRPVRLLPGGRRRPGRAGRRLGQLGHPGRRDAQLRRAARRGRARRHGLRPHQLGHARGRARRPRGPRLGPVPPPGRRRRARCGLLDEVLPRPRPRRPGPRVPARRPHGRLARLSRRFRRGLGAHQRAAAPHRPARLVVVLVEQHRPRRRPRLAVVRLRAHGAAGARRQRGVPPAHGGRPVRHRPPRAPGAAPPPHRAGDPARAHRLRRVHQGLRPAVRPVAAALRRHGPAEGLRLGRVEHRRTGLLLRGLGLPRRRAGPRHRRRRPLLGRDAPAHRRPAVAGRPGLPRRAQPLGRPGAGRPRRRPHRRRSRPRRRRGREPPPVPQAPPVPPTPLPAAGHDGCPR